MRLARFPRGAAATGQLVYLAESARFIIYSLLSYAARRTRAAGCMYLYFQRRAQYCDGRVFHAFRSIFVRMPQYSGGISVTDICRIQCARESLGTVSHANLVYFNF